MTDHLVDVDVLIANQIVTAMNWVDDDKTLYTGASGYLYVLLTLKQYLWKIPQLFARFTPFF